MSSLTDSPRSADIRWYHSIRFRMVLTFSALTLVVLFSIQLIEIKGLPLLHIEGNVREMTGHQFDMLSAVADSRKKLITDWIDARRRNTLSIAALPAARNKALRANSTVREARDSWLEEFRTIYQLDAVRLIDPATGAVLFAAPVEAAASPLSRVQLTEAARPGVDESIILTGGHTAGASHLHLIRQVVPQDSQDGRPDLLVEIECNLENLLKPQLDAHMQSLLGKSGEVLLMDGEGHFLTNSMFPMADGAPVKPLITKDLTPQVKLALSGSEGTIESRDYRNVPVLAAYRHIQITPDVAWGMVVKRDRSEVFTKLQHHLRTFIWLALAATIATILLAMLLSHRLSQPLRSIVETARTVRQGDLTARTNVTGKDETAELAEDFNTMLDQLQAWHTELDYRVRQRTEQLVEANFDLQNEIAERTKTEDALHEKTVQLEEEIAERQKAQDALTELNNSLEERIAATIVELRQKDDLLIQQNRMAAMGELLTSIAHQWRQPLNNIAAYIQTMQFLHRNGELTTEEMDRDIKAVMEILQYMSHTIDDFRNFFRKDREQRQFCLKEAIDRSLNLISAGLKSSDIRVVVTGDESLTASGFPNEYSQVLVNILYNARDILQERNIEEPKIEITIFREAGRSVVTIQDNGGGIPQEAFPHIFDPYFTTKGPATGTGIGLYMAKSLIERNMGGVLTARNTVEGAEFKIAL